MLVKTGFATLTRNPGEPASPHSFTGVCFKPKALLVWANNNTPGMGYGPAGEVALQFGWTTGPSAQMSQRTRVDAGSTRFTTEDDTKIGGIVLAISLTSFDADGFTMSLPFNGSVSFFWMALGGDDLQVKQGVFTPAAAGSSRVVTGLGFRPDFLLALHSDDPEELGFNYSFGMASGPSEQACVCGAQWIFSSKNHTLLNGRLCAPAGAGGTGYDVFATSLASFDSDGFTVATNSASAINGGVYYLALKDPTAHFKAGVESVKTSPGLKATSVGFRPGAGIFAPSLKLVDDDTTRVGYGVYGVGAADGRIVQGYAGLRTAHYSDGGQVGFEAQDAVLDVTDLVAGVHTNLARAALDSWDPGGFTLDWSVADGNAYKFLYGVFGTRFPDPCLPGFPVSFAHLKLAKPPV